MKCTGCRAGSEGYAVIPGIGEFGEIRFYCDPCARRERVKMRYWDARECEMGGHRDTPDVGDSFHTLVFTFDDLGRMRRQDLRELLEWVDDQELLIALRLSPGSFERRLFDAMGPERTARLRALRERNPGRDGDIEAARRSIVDTLRRL